MERLQRARLDLLDAAARDVREVRDADGHAVVYRSHAEIMAALRLIDLEILKLKGTASRTVRPIASKGV